MTSHRNKKLTELLESGDVLGFKTLIKKVLTEELDDQIPAVIDAAPLGSLTPDAAPLSDTTDMDGDGDNDTAPDDTGTHEAVCLDQIRKSAVAVGGDEGYYEGGVLDLSIPSLAGAREFGAFLDNFDAVESYEIEGLNFDDSGDILPGEDKDIADITDGEFVAFEFYIYIKPDLVVEAPVAVSSDEVVPDENMSLTEIKRVVRLKFGLNERSMMQCAPGTRFSDGRCAKLSENMQHDHHKAMKRARIASKAISGASHTQVSKKSFKNAKARKSFGSGR